MHKEASVVAGVVGVVVVVVGAEEERRGKRVLKKAEG